MADLSAESAPKSLQILRLQGVHLSLRPMEWAGTLVGIGGGTHFSSLACLPPLRIRTGSAQEKKTCSSWSSLPCPHLPFPIQGVRGAEGSRGWSITREGGRIWQTTSVSKWPCASPGPPSGPPPPPGTTPLPPQPASQHLSLVRPMLST